MDPNRYVARSNDQRGVLTLYWEETEKDEREDTFRAICNAIVNIPNARRLNYTCCATLALYADEQCAQRLQMWSDWHQHWVYSAQPSMPFPPSMPCSANIPPPAEGRRESAQEKAHHQMMSPVPNAWDLFGDVFNAIEIVDFPVSESPDEAERSDTSSLTSDIDTCGIITDDLPNDDDFERGPVP